MRKLEGGGGGEIPSSIFCSTSDKASLRNREIDDGYMEVMGLLLPGPGNVFERKFEGLQRYQN